MTWSSTCSPPVPARRPTNAVDRLSMMVTRAQHLRCCALFLLDAFHIPYPNHAICGVFDQTIHSLIQKSHLRLLSPALWSQVDNERSK
eukprot:527450-Hanusia_phi.AAC.4